MALDLKLEVEEVKLLLESAYLLTERREYGKAKEVFEAVEAIGKGADIAQIGLANLQLIQGNQKEAEKLLKAALKTDPKNASAHAHLGELYHTLGRKEDALASLKEAEKLDGQGAAGRYARSVREVVEQGLAYTYGVAKKK